METPSLTREATQRPFLPRSTGLVAILATAWSFVLLCAIPVESPASSVPGEGPCWKAGVARVVVTPEKFVELPYRKVVTRPESTAALRDNNAILARWAARMLRKLDAGEKFMPSYPYPVHAWRLGREMLLIGLGAETDETR